MAITINANKEELILKLKQNLEDSWSGASQIIEELENINEQASNDGEITKESVLEAITDIIRDAKGNDMDLIFDDEDGFGSYEETDFSGLADLDD